MKSVTLISACQIYQNVTYDDWSANGTVTGQLLARGVHMDTRGPTDAEFYLTTESASRVSGILLCFVLGIVRRVRCTDVRK